MKNMTLTVGQLNEYVRRSLASDPMLRGICVTGEISNFKQPVSGHWYFTLKDRNAAINCAMFRQSAMSVRFRPENGQQVRLLGSVGLYPKTGSYQFYADAMEPAGMGDLYLRFEQLKLKLAVEGLFDPALKKPLPLLPKGIGIVTSKTGAVIHDIARISWRRYSGVPLYLCPVKVQGDGAAQEIAAGIRLMNRLKEIDVIIVGRGGGSIEDLWAFNEECVARAIAASKKPVVSAVGHETDYTIADFAADVRAATPSAAAELAVPQKTELLTTLRTCTQALEDEMAQAILARRQDLLLMQSRLKAASPTRYHQRMLAAVQLLRQRMDGAAVWQLSARRHALNAAQLRLRTSGPVETMRRGYGVIAQNGKAIRQIRELSAGSQISLLMADGCAEATVTHIQPYEE